MKSSIYYFHMKTEILADFQICIGVPLKGSRNLANKTFNSNFNIYGYLSDYQLSLETIWSEKT